MLWSIVPGQHRKNRNICVLTRPLTANRPAWRWRTEAILHMSDPVVRSDRKKHRFRVIAHEGGLWKPAILG